MKLPLHLTLLAIIAITPLFAGGGLGDYQRALSLPQRTEGLVFRDAIHPRWLADKKHLWYRVASGPDTTEHVLIDATTGAIRRGPTARELGLPESKPMLTSKGSLVPKRSTDAGEPTALRMKNASASTVAVFWVDADGKRNPYGSIRAGETRELGTYAGHVWLVKDGDGAPLAYFEATPEAMEVEIDGKAPEPAAPERDSQPGRSPDGRHTVRFENSNAMLVSADGETTRLTTDGTNDSPYRGPVSWSPDSRHCVVQAVNEAPRRIVTVIESSPRNQLQPKLRSYDYYKPGDALPRVRPVLIDAGAKTARIIPDHLFPNPFTPDGELEVRWPAGGGEFHFDYNQRGHQVYRILAVNASTGKVRTVVEERCRTFIDWTAKTWRAWLDDTNELLWMSERDGWPHLYLYDVPGGKLKHQVTRGEWVLREVLKVDAAKRQVWFLAGGVRPGEDPYHRHLCRVNLDGSGFARLTQGDGDHVIEFSPDGEFFIDRWSRVDQPQVTELRRSKDGRLVCELERADASRLLQAGWSVPERFSAKGRDGKTDIHGVIVKPSNFDPAMRYPVVEDVYAGPQDSFAPKRFDRLLDLHQIAELGFIVVQADGMGTNNRGKAFHDVCWKNLKDAGFPDRIAWIKAAAASRPWMDLARVGIHGGSAGGQNAMRALLDHHSFYKVAVADCGCHDNRMDKIWWNEQWLGWPVDDSYAKSSNVVDAHKLQGKLLLIVGELDHNVDPASTMQVADALQRADKDFELLVVTGAGHGAAETPYGSRRRMDFLVRNLLGVVPRHNGP